MGTPQKRQWKALEHIFMVPYIYIYIKAYLTRNFGIFLSSGLEDN